MIQISWMRLRWVQLVTRVKILSRMKSRSDSWSVEQLQGSSSGHESKDGISPVQLKRIPRQLESSSLFRTPLTPSSLVNCHLSHPPADGNPQTSFHMAWGVNSRAPLLPMNIRRSNQTFHWGCGLEFHCPLEFPFLLSPHTLEFRLCAHVRIVLFWVTA